MSIQYFQPPTLDNQPNLSPFCAKTQIMLMNSGIEFETHVQGDPTKGPKQKVPFIVDKDVPLGDSHFIEQHLLSAYGVDFYANVPPRERAIAKLVQAAIEEKLYWVMVYSRWQVKENWPIMEELFFGQMPPDMRSDISKRATEAMLAALWGQGMGRHSTDEVYEIGREMIDNLAQILGENSFFVGSAFTSLDASVYGTLINLVQNPVPTPLKAHIIGKPNLAAFLDNMSDLYFPNTQKVAA